MNGLFIQRFYFLKIVYPLLILFLVKFLLYWNILCVFSTLLSSLLSCHLLFQQPFYVYYLLYQAFLCLFATFMSNLHLFSTLSYKIFFAYSLLIQGCLPIYNLIKQHLLPVHFLHLAEIFFIYSLSFVNFFIYCLLYFSLFVAYFYLQNIFFKYSPSLLLPAFYQAFVSSLPFYQIFFTFFLHFLGRKSLSNFCIFHRVFYISSLHFYSTTLLTRLYLLPIFSTLPRFLPAFYQAPLLHLFSAPYKLFSECSLQFCTFSFLRKFLRIFCVLQPNHSFSKYILSLNWSHVYYIKYHLFGYYSVV